MCVWERERERERERESSEGEAEREEEKNPKQASHYQCEPDEGLELTNHEIMTWAETDWATQVPQRLYFLKTISLFVFSKQTHVWKAKLSSSHSLCTGGKKSKNLHSDRTLNFSSATYYFFDLRIIKYPLLKNSICGIILIIYNLFQFFLPLQSSLTKVRSFKHQALKKGKDDY